MDTVARCEVFQKDTFGLQTFFLFRNLKNSYAFIHLSIIYTA